MNSQGRKISFSLVEDWRLVIYGWMNEKLYGLLLTHKTRLVHVTEKKKKGGFFECWLLLDNKQTE